MKVLILVEVVCAVVLTLLLKQAGAPIMQAITIACNLVAIANLGIATINLWRAGSALKRMNRRWSGK